MLELSFPRKPRQFTNVAWRFPRKLVSVLGKQSGRTRLAGSQIAAVYVLLAVLCGVTSYSIGVVFTESATQGLHQYFKLHATLLGIFGNGTAIGMLLLSLPDSLIKRIYGRKYRSTADDILAGILIFVIAAAIAAAAVAMLLILVTNGYSKADLVPLTYSFYRSFFGGGLLIIFGSLAGISVGFVRDRRG